MPWSALSLASLVLLACDAGALPSPSAGRLHIDVAPLSLTGVTDARYTLRVFNGDGQEVWHKQVSSTRHGDGAGGVSFVGPCDADAARNRVEVVLDALFSVDGELGAGDYVNPAPSEAPLTREITCEANQDVAVTFDITIARAARQGFFDFAMELVDVFCSAKLDCEGEDGEPLRLLFDSSGQRNDTAVLALACTAGPGSDTQLYLSDLTIACADGDITIDPSLGPGRLSAVAGSGLPNAHLFDALVTRGVEQLGFNKRYWNVALGLSDIAGCTLSAMGTATDGLLTDGATPDNTTWPYIVWSQPLESCTRHALDSGDGAVSVAYSDLAGVSFAHYFDGTLVGTFTNEVPIIGGLTSVDPGRWADGTDAPSCDGYLNPTAPYVYTGSTGDGYYRVDPDGVGGLAAEAVYCDMSGGGWTLVFDEHSASAIDQPIPPAIRAMAIGELRAIARDDTERILALHAGLGSLDDAFAQSWQATGFEDDNYKVLSVETGDHTTSLYIMDDHDIAGSGCSGHQITYAGTPEGLISFGYIDSYKFADGGTCEYTNYPYAVVDRLYVR